MYPGFAIFIRSRVLPPLNSAKGEIVIGMLTYVLYCSITRYLIEVAGTFVAKRKASTRTEFTRHDVGFFMVFVG